MGVKWVDVERDGIVASGMHAALGLPGHDPLRLAVGGVEGDVDVPVIVAQVGDGLSRGWAAVEGVGEAVGPRSALPARVREVAVDHRRHREGDGFDLSPDRRFRLGTGRRSRDKCQPGEPQPAESLGRPDLPGGHGGGFLCGSDRSRRAHARSRDESLAVVGRSRAAATVGPQPPDAGNGTAPAWPLRPW